LLSPIADLDLETSRFRSDPWPFQQTFKTPLKELEDFVGQFISSSKTEDGTLSTDLVVFEPRNMLELLQSASVPVDDQWRFTIRAVGEKSSSELLIAALGDWIDFAFVPRPANLAIYADHDEYTTFYGHDRDALDSLTSSLKEAGYEQVPDYVRGPASDGWR
jgi:hypothetical protein